MLSRFTGQALHVSILEQEQVNEDFRMEFDQGECRMEFDGVMHKVQEKVCSAQ